MIRAALIKVTRRYRFAASHRLHSGKFSEQENREMYGKCNNPYGHGHDYILDVTAAGPMDSAVRAGHPNSDFGRAGARAGAARISITDI